MLTAGYVLWRLYKAIWSSETDTSKWSNHVTAHKFLTSTDLVHYTGEVMKYRNLAHFSLLMNAQIDASKVVAAMRERESLLQVEQM